MNSEICKFIAHAHAHQPNQFSSNAMDNMLMNPNLYEYALMRNLNYASESRRLGSLWGNPSDSAIELAAEMVSINESDIVSKYGKNEMPTYVNKIDYYYAARNHNEKIVERIIFKYEHGNYDRKASNAEKLWFNEMCANPHPSIVEIIKDKLDNHDYDMLSASVTTSTRFENDLNMYRLSANPTATQVFLEQGLLERNTSCSMHVKRTLWGSLSMNPHPKAISYLRENIDKVDFSWLSSNPSNEAVSILKEYYNRIDWKWMSTNPAAIQMLKENMNKVDMEMLMQNPHPDAISMMYKLFDPSAAYKFNAAFRKNFIDKYKHEFTKM